MHCSSRGTGCARVLFPPAYFQGLPEQWTRAPARGTDHSRAVLSLCGDCTWRARVAMRCAVQVHYQIRLRETLIAVPYGSPTVAADGSAALQSFLHGFILRRTTPRRGALRLARAAAPYTYSSIASLVVKMQVICIQSSGSRVGNRLSFEWAIITREAGASERIEEETHRGMPRLKAGGTSVDDRSQASRCIFRRRSPEVAELALRAPGQLSTASAESGAKTSSTLYPGDVSSTLTRCAVFLAIIRAKRCCHTCPRGRRHAAESATRVRSISQRKNPAQWGTQEHRRGALAARSATAHRHPRASRGRRQLAV